MPEISVSLHDRSYPIRIGTGLLLQAESFAALSGKRFVVVSNDVVAPLYLSGLLNSLAKVGADGTAVVLPDGEANKHSGSLNLIYEHLLANRCDRGTTLIALGGGVVGDVTGFAAATYQRGIPFIQIPTTLLSQVDSSVGGKTGINHPLGKNMIGAFWQPKLVIADTSTLQTLPGRELSAGLAEVIKYGLIRDLPLLEWLESNVGGLMRRDPELLGIAIERSCANKAAVVADDEFETAKDGGRALLNLGHTFGHAIETGMGYGTWLHGEAVAAGTIIAATLSCQLGWLTVLDLERVRRLLLAAELPIVSPKLGVERYLELMSHDKKVISGKLRLVLLKGLGNAVTAADIPLNEIRRAIEVCCDA